MRLKNYKLGQWLLDTPPDDIIFSFQVRLYRNLAGYKFHSRMSPAERQEVLSRFHDFCTDDPELKKNSFILLNKLSAGEKELLKEERLLTETVLPRSGAGLIVIPEKNASIILNDNEHITVNANAGNLKTAYETANWLDDRILNRFDVAFSEKLGFLTSSSGFLSNGLRITALLHLPALKRAGKLKDMITELEKNDFRVVDVLERENILMNDMLFVENKGEKYFLKTETEAVIDFENTVRRIVAEEQSARQNTVPLEVKDEIGRAYGVLKYAARLELREALYYLSLLIWGVSLKMFTFDMKKLKKLTVLIQPGHLSVLFEDLQNPRLESLMRARLIQQEIRQFILSKRV